MRRFLRHPATAPALVGIVAFAISLVATTVPSLWYDEAATASSTSRDLSQLWREIGSVDAVHGLYYAVMHLIFEVFGFSPFTLRAPSAIAIGVAAAFTVVLGRQFGTTRLAVTAGLVFAILPRTTWAGIEGRSYAATAAAAVILTVVFVHAIRSSRRAWWVLYGAIVLVSFVLFIYLALIVLAHAVTIVLLARDRRWRTTWRPWLLSTVAAGVAAIPFGLLILGQTKQVVWIPPLGVRTFGDVIQSQWFFTSWPFAIVGWFGIVAGIVIVLRSRASDQRAAVLLPVLLAPTVALLLVTLVVIPLFSPRYLTLSLPFVGLIIAVAIDAIRMRWARLVALALLVALAVPQIVIQRQPEIKDHSSWSEVADLVAEQRALDGPDARTGIIYGPTQRHPKSSSQLIAYSYPDAFVDTVDVTVETTAIEGGTLWEKRQPLYKSLDRLEGLDTVYLVTSFASDFADDRRAATTVQMKAAGWRLESSWQFTRVHVLKYVPDTPE